MEILDRDTHQLPDITPDDEMEQLLRTSPPESPGLPPEEALPEEDPFPPEDTETAAQYMEDLDIRYPPENLPVRKKGVRAELVMGFIAILAAALLPGMVLLCLPYFGSDEDPEAMLHHREDPILLTEPTEETILEPTVSETEPENPTIPPDPNPYDRYDFQYNRHNYLLLQNLDSSPGVDVSAFQGNIDWEKVAGSGIEFAIIRLGYRGYETGKLVEDEYAKQNLRGAKDAGLKIGAYFFSQALDIEEAQEEIDYMLNILGEQHLDMPIILDWEIPAGSARTANMDARTLTDIQLYFCLEMETRGYQPMIYFNWHQSENLYYLHELEGAPFWLALYQDRMTYPWKVEMWQYTDRGRVPGINGNVDLNVYMPD